MISLSSYLAQINDKFLVGINPYVGYYNNGSGSRNELIISPYIFFPANHIIRNYYPGNYPSLSLLRLVSRDYNYNSLCENQRNIKDIKKRIEFLNEFNKTVITKDYNKDEFITEFDNELKVTTNLFDKDVIKNNLISKMSMFSLHANNPHMGESINYESLNIIFDLNTDSNYSSPILHRKKALYTSYVVVENNRVLFARYLSLDNIVKYIALKNLEIITGEDVSKQLASLFTVKISNELIDKRNKKRKFKEIFLKFIESMVEAGYAIEKVEGDLNNEILFSIPKLKAKTPKEYKKTIINECANSLGINKELIKQKEQVIELDIW